MLNFYSHKFCFGRAHVSLQTEIVELSIACFKLKIGSCVRFLLIFFSFLSFESRGQATLSIKINVVQPPAFQVCEMNGSNVFQFTIENNSGLTIPSGAHLGVDLPASVSIPNATISGPTSLFPIGNTSPITSGSTYTGEFTMNVSCGYLDGGTNASFPATFSGIYQNNTLSSHIGGTVYEYLFSTTGTYTINGTATFTPAVFHFDEVGGGSGLGSIRVDFMDFIDNPNCGVSRVLVYQNTGSATFEGNIVYTETQPYCPTYFIQSVTIDYFDMQGAAIQSIFSGFTPCSLVTCSVQANVQGGSQIQVTVCYGKIDPDAAGCPIDFPNNTQIDYSFQAQCVTGACTAIAGQVSFIDGLRRPQLVLSRINPQNNITTGHPCFWDIQPAVAGTTRWRFAVANDGDDAARDISFRLFNPYPTSTYFIERADIAIDQNFNDGTPVNATLVNEQPLAALFPVTAPFPECVYSLTDPIREITFQVPQMLPGQRFEFTLDITECCPSNNALFPNFYFDNPVFFNRWSFVDREYRDDCIGSTPLTIQTVGLEHDKHLTTAGLNGNPDIELEQSYYPAHADMDMAQGTGCSSPGNYEFVINNLNFNKAANYIPPFNLWGAQSLLDEIDESANWGTLQYAAQGIVVRFFMDAGLFIGSGMPSHNDVFFSTPMGVNWNFDLSQVVYNNGCPGNESNYELFFRFSDLAPVPQTVTELLDILSVVQFHFFLQGCCSCLVPLPIGTNGMNANPSYDVQFFLRKGAGQCDIPLERQNNFVQLHCPGCELPGPIITSDSEILERTTFGWLDSNNDGRADIGLIPANGNTNGIAVNRSMQGDILRSTINFRISPASSPTYTIQSLAQANPPVNLNRLYVEFLVPFSEANNFDLEVRSITFTMTRSGVSRTFTHIPPQAPAISPFFSDQRNLNGLLAFDFQISKIDAEFSGLGLGTFNEFMDNDQFNVTLEFCVRGNGPQSGSADPDDNRFESLVQASAYLTGVDLWSQGLFNAYFGAHRSVASDQWGGAPNPVDENWLYVCETRSAYHYFFRKFTTMSTTYHDVDVRGGSSAPKRCVKILDFRIVSRIGGNLRNSFPNEFRPVPFPTNLTFDLAPFDAAGGANITFERASLTSRIETFDQLCSPSVLHQVDYDDQAPMISPSFIPSSLSSFEYDLASLIQQVEEGSILPPSGCTPGSVESSHLLSGDENGVWEIGQPFTVNACNVLPDEFNLAQHFSIVDLEEDASLMSCALATPLQLQGVNTNIPILRLSRPDLNIQGPVNSDLETDELIGVYTLTNIDEPWLNDIRYVVEHPFIFIPTLFWMSQGGISLEINGSLISGNAVTWGTAAGSPPGILFELPSMLSGSNVQCTVRVAVAQCNDNLFGFNEIIQTIVGWDCSTLPIAGSVDPSTICFMEPVDWQFFWTGSNVSIDVDDNISIPSCSPGQFDIQISVLQGSYRLESILLATASYPDLLNLLNVDVSSISFTGDGNPVPTLSATISSDCSTLNIVDNGTTPTVLGLNPGEIEVLVITIPVVNYCLGTFTMNVTPSLLRYCNSPQVLNSKAVVVDANPNCDLSTIQLCNTDGLFDLTTIDNGTIDPTQVGVQGIFFDPSSVLPNQDYTVSFEHQIQPCSLGVGGCTYYSDLIIHVENCAFMTLNASLICDGESTTLSPSNINLTAPYSYIWSANGTTLSTLSSITVSPSSTTVYTVVVTGNNGTATASATTTVQVLPNLGADCCVPSDFLPGTDFSLANTTISAFAAAAGWGSSVSTANKILINGTLTIDQNFTFSNCDHIIMGPNAQINVLPGVQFEVLFSHIYSCEAMWQSINLYPDGSLRIADSQIEDGLAAVRSWGVPALLEVFSNTFDANKTAVELTEGDFSSATFYSNLFQCTRYIKPASNLEWALHHFYLRDAEHVTIGSPTHNPNVIEDARYGVFAERTDFSIQNNEFRHQHSPIVKYGIYADGFVPGSFYGQYAMNVGDLSPNIFESVRTGIFVSKNYDAFIFGNQFNSTGTGVFVYNCLARQIEVTQNTLAGFSHYGIQLQDNHDASITVSQNQMNSGFVYPADDESRKGIYVNNSTYLKAPLVIEGNDITNCYTGIQVMNQNTANIKSNVIRFSVPDAVIDLAIEYRQGIWLQLSQNLSVHGNQILRNCTSCGTTLQTGHEEYMRGIICDQALQAQVHDNTLQNIPQGMLTLQQGFGNQYFCNYLEGFISGMYFYGASIDPQGDVTNTTDNQWALGIGNKIDGELDPPGSNVDWYFDYIPGDLHDPQPYSVFVVQELGGTSSTSCNVVLPIVSEPKKLSDLLADSTYQAYLTEKKLYDRLIVYRQLKDSLQLMYSGSTYDLTLQNFFNLMALGNTGYLENVKDALNNGDKAAAEIANQQVNPSNLHEANSKCVNEILIASDKDSIYYDATGRSMLLGIAYQNPLIGGEAVYRARAILRLDLEDQMIGFRVGSISGSSSYGFEVFPNPSTGEYTVAANRLSKIPVELEAYNLLGSLVSSATIEPGASSGKLNMNYCPPGLYRLVIHHETGLTTRSIVLIR